MEGACAERKDFCKKCMERYNSYQNALLSFGSNNKTDL